jgi:hypothetical protein
MSLLYKDKDDLSSKNIIVTEPVLSMFVVSHRKTLQNVSVDKYQAQVAALTDLGTMDPQIRYL